MDKILAIKSKKLASKLTLKIFVALLLVFLVMVFSVGVYTKEKLEARETDKLELLALQNAKIASEFMETMLNKQSVIISAINSLKKVDDENKVRYIKTLLTDIGKNEDNILSVFFVAEPNTFVKESPQGFSVFATKKSTEQKYYQFGFVDKTAYETAKETKKMVIVDPFEKEIDGQKYTVITVFQPVLDEKGEVTGMVGSNIDAAVLNSAAYNTGGYKSFTNQIICRHQTIIIHSADPEKIGKKLVDVTTSTNPDKILNAAEDAKTVTFLDKDVNGKKDYRSFVPFYVGTSDVAWLSGTSISQQEFNAPIISQVIMTSAIAAVGLLLLVLFCFLNIKQALHPLAEIENAAKQMSKGNLGVTVNHVSNDELGSLAKSFNASVNTLSFYISDIDRVMDDMSSGNFDVGVSKPFIGDFAGIERSINEFVAKICDTLNKINTSSNFVAASSEQLSQSSAALSQGASEQASTIEELSTTILEISKQVSLNSQNAKKANDNVLDAGTKLQQSNAQMQEMILAMDTISNSSDSIGKIIKTIQDIAFQTNILALNAAVEAARAGAAGKGFAVVADEVRNLAGKSAEAAQYTTELIEGSIRSVKDGVKIAQSAADSLSGVVTSANAVVVNMEEISKACENEAAAIIEVTGGTAQISNVISQNSATAEQSAAASEELSSQAQILKELVTAFHFTKTKKD